MILAAVSAAIDATGAAPAPPPPGWLDGAVADLCRAVGIACASGGAVISAVVGDAAARAGLLRAVAPVRRALDAANASVESVRAAAAGMVREGQGDGVCALVSMLCCALKELPSPLIPVQVAELCNTQVRDTHTHTHTHTHTYA